MIFDIIENASPSVFSFVATTPGAIELAISGPGIIGEALLSASGDSWFQPGDSILLQSIGWDLPFGFGKGSGPIVLGLQWVDNLNVFYPLPEFGPSASIFLPSICSPLIFPGQGLYCKRPVAAGARLQLRVTASSFGVSMVNLPAVLNGVTVGGICAVGVIHTLPLLAVP